MQHMAKYNGCARWGTPRALQCTPPPLKRTPTHMPCRHALLACPARTPRRHRAPLSWQPLFPLGCRVVAEYHLVKDSTQWGLEDTESATAFFVYRPPWVRARWAAAGWRTAGLVRGEAWHHHRPPFTRLPTNAGS